MALYKDESQDDGPECPVCYEYLSGTERTLSCGHVFCHDCLVKTLVTINSDGNIRNTIVCSICRHLTFIEKQNEARNSLEADKDPKERQTLKVPLPLPVGQQQSARRASGDSLRSEVYCITRCFRGFFQRARRQKRISPCQKGSQIFIISAQGRPMTEGDAPGVVISVARPQRRRRICTTTGWLFCLLSLFVLLAVTASVFPWIVLM